MVDSRFIWLRGKLRGRGEMLNLINIYAPNIEQERKILWDKLSEIMDGDDKHWCLGGDFNTTLVEDERMGNSDDRRSRREFQSFLDRTGLIDLPMAGGRFTWSGNQGASKSRIDPFLVSPEWITLEEHWIQKSLRTCFSDHIPICIEAATVNWGPKPFRCFNHWLGDDKFVKLVEEC